MAARVSDEAAEDAHPTLTLAPPPHAGSIRGFRLEVLEGPSPGRSVESRSERLSLGHHPSNDLQLKDVTVSRFHAELTVEGERVRVRDLGSRNGTLVDGVAVNDAFLSDGSKLRLGRVVVGFELANKARKLKLAERSELGGLVGTSAAMRACFALMERAASSDVTLLLEGETGTGKSAAAEAIHASSARKKQPFLVVDCGAIPAPLLESELFGHEKGAFTGASERRKGAFEEARGGTIFLDEVGELPAELQPKLLRVLEKREIRRVGSNEHLKVDVRILAATNRDLRLEVNAGRFRSDLFFRLAVVKIRVPSLRERVEDVPLLIDSLLAARGYTGAEADALRDPALIRSLQAAPWPGNVRELRNYLERWLFYGESPPADEAPQSVDLALPFSEARRQALESFERSYLKRLLQLHQGRMKETAEAAGINRIHLYKLLRRLGLHSPR
jgi:two-component system response regulator GlrR